MVDVNKENIIYYEIPFLLSFNLNKIEVFMIQYRLDIKLLGGLLWIAIDWSDHAQLISIGIYKVYFQFGPGIKPWEIVEKKT